MDAATALTAEGIRIAQPARLRRSSVSRETFGLSVRAVRSSPKEILPPCLVLPGDVADEMFHVKHPDFVISALC